MFLGRPVRSEGRRSEPAGRPAGPPTAAEDDGPAPARRRPGRRGIPATGRDAARTV